MMRPTSRNSQKKFILKYGTDVEINRGGAVIQTKAVIGRLGKTTTNMLILEGQKEAIFPYDVDVNSGDIVYNNVHNETYIVSSTHQTYYGNDVLDKVAILLICNATFSVYGKQTVADNRGNLKTVFAAIVSDLPCYVQEVTNELRRYDPGLYQETDYRIFSTAIDIKEEDQIVLNVGGKTENFKIISKNYLTYPGMVVLQVSRDIRKG